MTPLFILQNSTLLPHSPPSRNFSPVCNEGHIKDKEISILRWIITSAIPATKISHSLLVLEGKSNCCNQAFGTCFIAVLKPPANY